MITKPMTLSLVVTSDDRAEFRFRIPGEKGGATINAAAANSGRLKVGHKYRIYKREDATLWVIPESDSETPWRVGDLPS